MEQSNHGLDVVTGTPLLTANITNDYSALSLGAQIQLQALLGKLMKKTLSVNGGHGVETIFQP